MTRIWVLSVLLLSTVTANAEAPLTDRPGNAERGRAVVLDRELGHCLLCHQIRQLEEGFQGNIGPDLSEVGNRLPANLLRTRLIDPTRANPESVMPAYYRTENLNQVGAAYLGKPILSAQQIEDVVAYLSTLKP